MTLGTPCCLAAIETTKQTGKFDSKQFQCLCKVEIMGVFDGVQLLKKDGSLVDAKAELAGKDVVLVYFSAHWCPPCRNFTPKLKDYFEDLKDKPIAIIFVSSDRSKEDMDAYYEGSHGDWYRAPFGSEWSNKLKENCQVQGIPTLAVVDKDGNLINKNARSNVDADPPAAAFQKWKEMY